MARGLEAAYRPRRPWSSWSTPSTTTSKSQLANSLLNLDVKIANSCFLFEKQKKDLLQQKNILRTITVKVLRILDSRHPNIFSDLDSHVDPANLFRFESHKSLMIKKIVSAFISIRLKHFCKEYNSCFLDKKFKRVALKTIHFQGQ